MSKSSLSLAVLLAASGFTLLQLAELRPAAPAFQPERLCPELALQATPSRLITLAQTGASALFNCTP